VSITNDTAFPTANVKTYAGSSTSGLYHYPAKITNETWTWEISAFEPAGLFTERTTAGKTLIQHNYEIIARYTDCPQAVINNQDGREQMAFFLGWGTDWSATSNFLQHPWIHWMTRGLCK
jgi:hypothetical protein